MRSGTGLKEGHHAYIQVRVVVRYRLRSEFLPFTDSFRWTSVARLVLSDLPADIQKRSSKTHWPHWIWRRGVVSCDHLQRHEAERGCLSTKRTNMCEFAKPFEFKTRQGATTCCVASPTEGRNPHHGVFAVVALAVLSFVVGCGDGSSGPMSASESAAYEALREMGAVVAKNESGTRPATVMMVPTEKIKNDIDKAIEHVGQLPFVTHLELTGLPVTDEHMKTVRSMSRINSLVLTGTQVTDEGLKTAAGLDLNTLYVDKSQMTGAAMQTLGGMSGLEILDVSGLDLTDISPLTRLSELEWLIMDNSEIGGEAFDVVSQLPDIKRLSINGSNFAAADLQKLKSAKPSLKIDQTEAAPPEVAPAEAAP